jgi:2-keto-4-pentenoate hydratase/2-oxohepta-3-ene-1,7-dioic acid hydratase in catechol pathway
MSARLARTADGWWAVTPAGLVRLDLPAATTADLLADRAILQEAINAAQATAAAAPRDAVPTESVDLLSPVTAPARVVAQAVNYRSHATDSGFDPDGSRRRSSARPRTRSPGRPGTSSARTGSGSSTTRSN